MDNVKTVCPQKQCLLGVKKTQRKRVLMSTTGRRMSLNVYSIFCSPVMVYEVFIHVYTFRKFRQIYRLIYVTIITLFFSTDTFARYPRRC